MQKKIKELQIAILFAFYIDLHFLFNILSPWNKKMTGKLKFSSKSKFRKMIFFCFCLQW